MENRYTLHRFAAALAGAALWLAAPARAQSGPLVAHPAPAVLMAQEIPSLVFLREEEKLAQHVSMSLCEK